MNLPYTEAEYLCRTIFQDEFLKSFYFGGTTYFKLTLFGDLPRYVGPPSKSDK